MRTSNDDCFELMSKAIMIRRKNNDEQSDIAFAVAEAAYNSCEDKNKFPTFDHYWKYVHFLITPEQFEY